VISVRLRLARYIIWSTFASLERPRESQRKSQLGEMPVIRVCNKELPHHSVFFPHKALRNYPLTEDEKLANRELSSVRIVVENTIAEIKHFKVLADPFRHAVDIYDDVVCVLSWPS